MFSQNSYTSKQMFEPSTLISSLFFVILITSTLFAQIQGNAENVSYSISLNKKNFLPLEPIIVISKLKNIGNETIEVNEPCAPKFIVTYDIYKVEPNSLVRITGITTDHPAGPNKIILNPNDTCEGSSELHLTNGGVMIYPGLKPGEYIIKSKYHFKRFATINYDIDIIVSEVSFWIQQRNNEQERIFKEFSESMYDVSRLSAFIEKYPESPYNQYVLEKLSIEMYRQKKHREEIRIYEQMLQGQLSTYRRERILHGIASTYLLLGDVDGAIKFLFTENLPSLVLLRERLEQGKIPNEYKDAVKKAKEKAAVQNSSIPYLEQRLNSSIWQVRHSLLPELNRHDENTKYLLEILLKDESNLVRNQALVRYLRQFVYIKKELFDPFIYLHSRFPLQVLPKENFNEKLIDYCLGHGDITPDQRFLIDDISGYIFVLDVKEIDNPDMYVPITIIGILGNKKDVKSLFPFLDSSNDYVALCAAKSVIRLGEKDKGVQTLKRIINKPVKENLYYITESLYALKEVQYSDFEQLIPEILKKVKQENDIQPNWMSAFLMLAFEVNKNAFD